LIRWLYQCGIAEPILARPSTRNISYAARFAIGSATQQNTGGPGFDGMDSTGRGPEGLLETSNRLESEPTGTVGKSDRLDRSGVTEALITRVGSD